MNIYYHEDLKDCVDQIESYRNKLKELELRKDEIIRNSILICDNCDNYNFIRNIRLCEMNEYHYTKGDWVFKYYTWLCPTCRCRNHIGKILKIPRRCFQEIKTVGLGLK